MGVSCQVDFACFLENCQLYIILPRSRFFGLGQKNLEVSAIVIITQDSSFLLGSVLCFLGALALRNIWRISLVCLSVDSGSCVYEGEKVS